jgi:hypothetical protein
MQINIATGDAAIYAVQDGNYEKVTASTKREKLERHIRVLKRHLGEHKVDEQTRKDFEEEIVETEAELNKLKSQQKDGDTDA